MVPEWNVSGGPFGQEGDYHSFADHYMPISCESTGYGYSVDQPKSAGMVPGVLIYHLFGGDATFV
jgi:hypothetical protein